MYILPNNVWFLVTCLIFLCLDLISCDDNTIKVKLTNTDLIFNVSNILDKQLIRDNLKLNELDEIFNKFLKTKFWKFKIGDKMEVQVQKLNNTCWDVKLDTKNALEVGRGMKMSMKNSMKSVKQMMPYLIIPGLLMAGILPWVIPGLKMVVGTVSMINQMAFNAALFALVRSYIFDTESEEHIVYINHGYPSKDKPHHHHHNHHHRIR